MNLFRISEPSRQLLLSFWFPFALASKNMDTLNSVGRSWQLKDSTKLEVCCVLLHKNVTGIVLKADSGDF